MYGIQAVILMGGVVPKEYALDSTDKLDIEEPITILPDVSKPKIVLKIPNLHVIGDQDHHRSSSEALTALYNSKGQMILRHPEGHRIPTMSTGVYPKVLKFLQQNIR